LEVVNSSKVLPLSSHGVKHFIATKGLPISSKCRQLDAEKLAAAQAEFEQMEGDGIVQQSSSPWASPLHMVRKSDCSWWPCGDLSCLNLVTESNTYPLPNMLDFSGRVVGCKIFSKIDLRKGYYQISMHTADIRKTAIITPSRLFEFWRLPFGLRNAGNTFQRLMDRVLAGLPYVFCYLDDIIIASQTDEQHLQHLRQVFSRLRDAGLVINREKCVFAAASVDFLGHRVKAAGAAPVRTHVEALLAHPEPLTITQLQGFLGTVNFYRRFLPGAAKILLPLTGLLRGSPKGSEPVQLDETQHAAFSAAKQAVTPAVTLAHPHVGYQLSLMWAHPRTTSAQPFNSGDTASNPGSPLDFSPGSWTARSKSTLPLTESFSPPSRPSATSDISW